MKQTIYRKIYMILIAVILFFPGMSSARDFMVQFLEENYKQTNHAYSNFPEIYHSIQVMTDVAGPKLLVLSGDDHGYRTWLRQFIASGKSFIVKVPDDEADLFITSRAFTVDVTALHPVNSEKWKTGGTPLSMGSPGEGNRVMIVDTNEKRSRLIAEVVSHMGYTPSRLVDANQALVSFQQQPGKYDMIILDHEIRGISIEEFVRHVLAIDHNIPVIIGSGYKNTRVQDEISKNISSAPAVVVVPVVLRDLKNRIQQLLKPEA